MSKEKSITAWAVGDKVTCHIPHSGDLPAIVREVRMEGTVQQVRLIFSLWAPLLGKYLISHDKRWFDGDRLKVRVSVVPELGEEQEE